MIIAMFLVPVLAEGLGSWPERLSTDGTISDTCDADVCSKMWAEMGTEARNLVIMLYFDPFMLYKDNSKYSCAPLVAIFQNFPAHIRWKHVAAHLLGIEPGTKNRNVVPNRRSMFQLVSDEIAYLSMVGVMVHDKHKGDKFRYCFFRAIRGWVGFQVSNATFFSTCKFYEVLAKSFRKHATSRRV